MTEAIVGKRLFHVTRTLPYNSHPPLKIGDKLLCGQLSNPFFGYYECPPLLPVHMIDGSRQEMPLLNWLDNVRKGHINASAPLQTAYDIAKHFQMLARELQMEIVRLDTALDAPSRQSCLWATEDISEAKCWSTRLGGVSTILEIEATGCIHRADAALLPADAFAFSRLAEQARRYWLGEMSNQPEPEILFSGEAIVIAKAESASAIG